MNPVPNLPLRDIHLPSAIAWWPPAPGWWILPAFSLVFLIAVFLLVRRLSRPTLKKQAFRQLRTIENLFQQSENATQCISDLSAFLRRVVLCRSKHAAGITGTAWLHFLEQSLDAPEFSQGCGRILLKGPYQEAVDGEEVHQVIQLCHKWVDRL